MGGKRPRESWEMRRTEVDPDTEMGRGEDFEPNDKVEAKRTVQRHYSKGDTEIAGAAPSEAR